MTILTISEVAARLGVSRETVRRRIVDGELSYISIGAGKRETRRIPEESLAEFVRSRTRKRRRAPKIDAGPDLLVEAGGRWYPSQKGGFYVFAISTARAVTADRRYPVAAG